MTTKLSLAELKKRLSSKANAELVEEIAQLYKTFPPVKEYYQSTLLGDDSAILKKYKEIINGEFLMRGNRCPKMRLSVARKAVMDFKKISNSSQSIADIMITYVEAGVICSNEFGGINEPFYNSMESMYETALKYVVKEHLFADFDDRLIAIVEDTRGMGWGFHDQLSYLYEAYEAMVEKPQAPFSV
jgi:hypothetical protein